MGFVANEIAGDHHYVGVGLAGDVYGAGDDLGGDAGTGMEVGELGEGEFATQVGQFDSDIGAARHEWLKQKAPDSRQ